MLGRVFNTLNHQVSKALKESIDQNVEYKRNKWNLIEFNVVAWSKRPFLYLLGLIVLIFVYSLLFALWKQEIVGLVPSSVFPIERVVKWQGGFLAGQLTILGVIFPLVVGLVGVLLQRKSASKAIWYLYKRYSGFVFTGLSGILLAIVIILTSSMGLPERHDTYQILSALTTCWFVVNLFLTGWFLWVTFKMVEENARDLLLVKFAINEAFLDDIKRSLSAHIPHNIIRSYGLESGDFEISTFQFTRAGDESYQVEFKHPRCVSNVNFRFLYFAIWLTRLSNKSRNGRLVIPVARDRYSSSFNLVTTNGLVC